MISHQLINQLTDQTRLEAQLDHWTQVKAPETPSWRTSFITHTVRKALPGEELAVVAQQVPRLHLLQTLSHRWDRPWEEAKTQHLGRGFPCSQLRT